MKKRMFSLGFHHEGTSLGSFMNMHFLIPTAIVVCGCGVGAEAQKRNLEQRNAVLTRERDDLLAQTESLQEDLAKETQSGQALREEVSVLKKQADKATEEVVQMKEAHDRRQGEAQVLVSNANQSAQNQKEQVLRMVQELAAIKQAGKAFDLRNADVLSKTLDIRDQKFPWSIADPTEVYGGKTLVKAPRKAFRQLLDGDNPIGLVVLLDYDDERAADRTRRTLNLMFTYQGEDENLSNVGEFCVAFGGPGLYGLILKRGTSVAFMSIDDERPATIEKTDPLLRLAMAIDNRLKQNLAQRPGGTPVQPWLGISLKTPTATEKRPVVLEVDAGSPAALAGLEPGDVLVSIDDTRVVDGAATATAIDQVEIGKPVSVIVERGTDSRTLIVVFREKP